MKILVTGATGFIGSHLAEKLVKEGHAVRALVRGRARDGPYLEGLKVLERLNIRIVRGDLLDKKSLEDAVKGVDAVFHLAAIARPMAIPNEEYFRINEEGTRNLMEACRVNKVKKVVCMSSVSAVGPSRDGRPVNEKSENRPMDTYGWSKLAAEKVILDYIKNHSMHIIVLRPPMVFGPRDREMLRFFRMIKKRVFPIKYGKGYMEFLYVENLVDAAILAMKRGKKGEVYHINNGKSYRLREIVEAIAEAEGVKLLPIKLPNWSFVLIGAAVQLAGKLFRFHPPFSSSTVTWMTKSFWYSDSSKAQRELGYKPKFSLKEGVRKTVEYYSEKGLI